MTDGPRLTVAIPTCNGARHLAEALRGILAQAGVGFELVISDDRSEDETLAVVRAEAGDRARVVVNSERLGLAGNWNRCLALARAPFVAVFHQDDVMRPGHLATHIAAFEAGERVGLVASASDAIDAEGRAVPESVVGRGGLGPADRTLKAGESLAELAAGNPLRCSAVTIRAAAHADVGGFDPAYGYVLDWDFWIRVARRWDLAWRAHPTITIRWHPASETHRFKTGTTDLDESARVLERLWAEGGLEGTDRARLRRLANRRLARAFLNRAHDALRGGDPELARSCLARAWRLNPGVLGTIAADPRLAVELAALTVAPRAAARWFSRPLRS
jgi:glycosyltransferase involved in cell wall biosynthesis